MTEEEKSIKSMKEFAYTTYGVLTVEEAKTVLNLIQKQQEQIKELKQSLEIDDILLKREAELSEELKAEIKKKDKYTKDLCENYCPKKTKLEKKDKRIFDLEFALMDMVLQFAGESKSSINTMGLSALETAFTELNFDNPMPIKKVHEIYKKLAQEYYK